MCSEPLRHWICKSSFQRVEHFGRSKITVFLNLCPFGLYGAEQRIEVICARIIYQVHRRGDGEAVAFHESAGSDFLQHFSSGFTLINGLLSFGVLLVATPSYR